MCMAKHLSSPSYLFDIRFKCLNHKCRTPSKSKRPTHVMNPHVNSSKKLLSLTFQHVTHRAKPCKNVLSFQNRSRFPNSKLVVSASKLIAPPFELVSHTRFRTPSMISLLPLSAPPKQKKTVLQTPPFKRESCRDRTHINHTMLLTTKHKTV